MSQDNQDVAAINSYLDSATQTFKQQWPDGAKKSLNEGHQLNMDYLNAQLDCYSNHNQSGKYNEEVSRITDRKNDEQTTYQTQSEAASNAQTNRTTCITSAIGKTAYTNCY